MSSGLLVDNSAWVRFGHPQLSESRSDEIADMIESRRLCACSLMILEAGYSARNGSGHTDTVASLNFLPEAPTEPIAQARAIDAQAQLATAGHHRLPVIDLVIAATAEANGLGLLHYDSDYDLIREHTDLDFESVWLAPRGSL
jgi:predicted nucleic acid-binding protein